MDELLIASFILMTLASNEAMAGGSVCAGMQCSSGQCVSRASFCNGNCDCGDCSDERLQSCPFYDQPNRDSGSSGLSSGAIVGIVVAAICVLLLLIAILIVFLICRIRREALKNRRTRRGPLDPTAPGCALPVDIPIEALAREPPPQYTPRATTTDPSGEFSISVLPPPYYAPGTSAITELSYSYEAPPKYHSNNDLSKAVEVHHKMDGGSEPVDLRRTSVDSFVDEPSMSNMLLTSSRSSDLGFSSQQPSAISVDTSGHSGLVSLSARDSAWGDSGDGTSSTRFSSLATSSRSQSLSNILFGMEDISRHGIQTKREDQQHGHSKNTLLPSRSVPSLHEIHLTRPRQLNEGTSAAKQKQGKYWKKSNPQNSKKHDGNRTGRPLLQGSSMTPAPPQRPHSSSSSASSSSSSGNRLSSRKCISRSLPQLAVLQEEPIIWAATGSCEV